MEFIIDNREKIKDKFNEKYNPQCKNLDLGDYLINYNSNPVAIIERKTICDLIASINDGRYREQKQRLLANYPKSKVIYLIEGDITCDNIIINNKKIEKYVIYSTIINLYLRDNINVYVCKNSDESVEFIHMILEKINKKGIVFLDKTIKKDSAIINSYVCKKSKNITPDILYKMQLSLIPGISAKTSEIIITNYKDMKTFISELVNLGNDERITVLENLKCESVKRKLGQSLANKINDFMFSVI